MTTQINRNSPAPAAPAAPAAPLNEEGSDPVRVTEATAPEETVDRWATTSTPKPDNSITLPRAQNALVKLVLDQVARPHRLQGSVSYGLISGTALLEEQVGVRGTDVYRELVAPDRRRVAYADQHPDTLWVKSRALVGASVNFPLAGAALGFNGSVEVSSIAAQPKDFSEGVEGQVKSMYLPLRADGFKTLNAAPGSEWLIRGQAGMTFGNAGVDADIGGLATTAGVGASVSHQHIYTKNVKVLEDNKVFVLLGKTVTKSVSGALGADLGLVNMKDSSTKLVQRAGDAIERKTTLTAAISASVGWPERQLAGAVLDLEKPTDRMHYEYLMRASPLDGEVYIKANNLGANYTGEGRVISTGANIGFGSVKLLATSTVRSKETGEIVKEGVTSQLGEASYNRVVEGMLARMAINEERVVSVRAGTLTSSGVSNSALSVRLAVSDPDLTAHELAEHIRFAKAMGAPVNELPDPKSAASFGRGDTSVELAATHDQLRELGLRTSDEVRRAFAVAQSEIEGTDALPPWFEQPERLEAFRRQLANARGPRSDASSLVLDAYAAAYPGRNLKKDLASAEAVDFAIKQAAKCRGKPVEEWGKVLEAVGMRASNDVRTGLLALHRLSGAELVQLSTNAGGNRVTSTAGAAPMSLLDLVGSVMLPQ